jgi:DNA (cytosine-5)-methyltransferase 1
VIYYNEIDRKAASWLRELMRAGVIPAGDVDERSITDVRPGDLRGYRSCHFFAGIGGWAYALRLAGWPDDQPVWTGSCPCQPFSSAGKQRGNTDERHLWPVFRGLIAECAPAIVFGQQVASRLGRDWLATVRSDLEGLAYAVGAADLCAAGVGAPHIRQRLYWVANASGERRDRIGLRVRPETAGRRAGDLSQAPRRGEARELADTLRASCERGTGGVSRAEAPIGGARIVNRDLADGSSNGREAGDVGDTFGAGLERLAGDGYNRDQSGRLGAVAAGSVAAAGGAGRVADTGQEQRRRWEIERGSACATQGERDEKAIHDQRSGGVDWRDCDWIPCADGKARPVEPGSFPLAYGVPARVGRLRGYGNAIVPELAATFIVAAESCLAADKSVSIARKQDIV